VADNTALVEQAYEAFGRGDVPAVLALFDDEIAWSEAEGSVYWAGQPFTGPSAVVEGVFQKIPQDITDFRITVDRVVGCGDTVLVQGRYSGIWNSTGTAFDLQMAHVWDFRGEKVVRWQQYTDTLGWARATNDVG
jgi:ketosteroid isomerase-like protein